MKKNHAKIAAGLMAAFMGVSSLAPSSFAVRAAEGQDVSYVPDEYVIMTENVPDSDELFAQYVDREFGIEEDMYVAQEAQSYAVKSSGRAVLSGINKIVYDRLSEGAASIASGSLESSIFIFTPEDFGVGGSYSAEDLGVPYIIENNSINPQASSAMYGMLDLDYKLIINMLLYDTPYELYWYDKTIGIRLQPPGIISSYSDGQWELSFKGVYTIKMAVSADYRGTYSVEDYKVDTALTGAASSAAFAAEAVIEANKTKLDYDKLVAYRDYICNEVSFYSSGSNRNYGDPWQLIYVFDGNPNTNVVCEGYSKAFHYLCSKSVWHDPTLNCLTVDGNMSGGTGAGRHMWNVVRMDGVNYLADITNSDNGTAGADGSLFLKGASGGDLDTGFNFSYGMGKSISFIYDDGVRKAFDSSELILSYVDADPEAHREKYGHSWEGDGLEGTASCTESSERAVQCSICGLTENVTIGAQGHKLEYTAAVDPACEEAGSVACWTCSECGKHFSDEEGETEIENDAWVIPATGHNWEFIGFTWIQDGNDYRATADYVCRNDSGHKQSIEADIIKNENNEKRFFKASIGLGNGPDGIEHQDEKVVDGDHEHVMTGYDAVPATCEEDGRSAYWHCEGCGKYYADAEGKVEIKWNSWIIPATGHDWDEGRVTKAASCSSPGIVKYTCKNDHTHIYTDSIPELGHDWTTIVYRKPTCTRQGLSMSICKRNRRHIVNNIVPATGHDWDEGVVTKKPTETKTGILTYTCKNNNYHTHTEVIPALGTASGTGANAFTGTDTDTNGGTVAATGTGTSRGTETGAGTGTETSTITSEIVKKPLLARFRTVWRKWAGYMYLAD